MAERGMVEVMKKIRAFLISALFLVSALNLSGCSSEAKESFFAMNTFMNFTVCGENPEAALEKVKETVTELERLWSVTDSGSDIYKINHTAGQPVTVDERTAALISFALDMADKTEGTLNPAIYPVLKAWGFTTGENRIPSPEEISALLTLTDYEKVQFSGCTVTLPEGMMLDFGAVAKGYTGDILAEQLKAEGVSSALLDIGGNIQAVGARSDGEYWRVGLRDPFSDGILGTLQISDLAVVTSGNYERYFIGEDGKSYGHIIDPESGYPADNGLMSVTIMGKSGAYCDALSTALFVMGYDETVRYWLEARDFEMIIVCADGSVALTEGAKKLFISEGEYEITVLK